MPDSPAPADSALADALLAAARTLRRSWSAALEPSGLSPHHARALRVVGCGSDEGGDGVRISQLAASLRIAPRSATEVVDVLAERGLVERGTDPADRRAVVVRLTPAGVEARSETEAARTRAAAALFERLGDGERTELARLLRSLTR